MRVYNFKQVGNIGHIYIFGSIVAGAWPEYGEVSVTSFRDDFDALSDSCEELVVHINSPGGNVFEGLGICSIIKDSAKPVTTINEGIAFSMGAVVLEAGAKRKSARGALLMFHSAASCVSGNKLELAAGAELLGKFDESLALVISDRSGKSKEEIVEKYFDGKDHYLTAEEALAEGFIDEIVDSDAVLPKNVTDFKNRTAVIAAYADPANFADKRSFVEILKNLVSPKSKNVMDGEVLKVLNLNSNSDKGAVVAAINQIIKDRDDAKASLLAKEGEIADLAAERDTAISERDNLQAIVDKIPDGAGADVDGVDTNRVPVDYTPDGVNAVAKQITANFKKKR